MRDKPIEKATVFCAGDTTVGIPSSQFEIELFIDESRDESELNEIREKFESIYNDMTGDKCRLMFDFEVESMIKSESF